jgi:Na+/H+ antiporter NhaA
LFYTTKAEPVWLVETVAIAIAFRFAEVKRNKHKWLIRLGFGLALWYTVYQSGVGF